MIFLQTIEADGHRMNACPQKPLPTLRREMQRIGHHSPRKALFVNGLSAFFDVATHQRLASRDNHKHLVRIRLRSDAIEHTQEVLLGHIIALSFHLTVAATMATLQVAAQGALPEQLSERMFLTEEMLLLSPEFEGEFLLEGQGYGFHGFFFSLTSCGILYTPSYQCPSPSFNFSPLLKSMSRVSLRNSPPLASPSISSTISLR